MVAKTSIYVEPATRAADETVPSKPSGLSVMGYNLKDPQDLLSIFLIGVIAYNAIDLAVYFGGKLINGGSN